MPFKIRTKLIVAFVALISTIPILTGLVGYYNISASDRAVHTVEAIAEEIIVTGDLHRSLEHVLMPANDYLITGDRKYIDDFNVSTMKVEEAFKKTDELLGHLEAFGLLYVEEERKSLKDIKTAWLNIKELSLKILSIPDPIGNKDGAMMMEEMDYRWGGPATELIHKWQKGDVEEYKEAVELAEKARRMSWVIMGSAGTLLLILGAGFAVFYSGFFVRPIKKLHNGADAIAGGDFKSRVDVKTGDELEQLANGLNEMAEKLDNFYGSLEDQVKERTKDLRESEERFRQLFNSSSDAIFVHGITPDGKPGNFIEVNDISCDRLGYTRDELLKMSPVNIDDPEMAKQQVGVIKDFITKKNVIFEMVHIAKDERKIPVEINARFFELNKQPLVLSVARDITERKKADETLRASEEMYRSLFDNMLNGFAYCRMLFESGQPQDFIYLSVNNSFEALTGLKGVVGKKVTEVIPGIREADPGLFEIYGRVALSGNPERFEMYVEALRMWFWISVYSPHKEHFVAVFDVITERKMAEEALKESEERFRTITNTAGDAIICLEVPGNIKIWNKKAEEMFGYSADEVGGRDLHDLIVPETYREKAREGLKGFFQTGAGAVVGKTVELTALRKDGTEFPIALSISAMKIQEKWQATGIIRDITERKRAEEELAKHLDELERYMKATVQREFRIKELRDRVEELEKRLKG